MRMVRSMSRDVRRNRDELLGDGITETGGDNGVLAVQTMGWKYLGIVPNI